MEEQDGALARLRGAMEGDEAQAVIGLRVHQPETGRWRLRILGWCGKDQPPLLGVKQRRRRHDEKKEEQREPGKAHPPHALNSISVRSFASSLDGS